MSYRFYTSQEYARLNAADDARRRAAMGGFAVRKKYSLPIQEKLAAVIEQVQDNRQHLARMYLRLKTLSPKQIAAAQRWIDRTQGIAA